VSGNEIAAAFTGACREELDAPKPGNVHVFADGHRMNATEFILSADAAAAPLCAPGTRIGARILAAVEATAAAVGTNTNLGIILLCAPLAAAAEAPSSELRDSLAAALRALDVEDTRDAFRAIVRAAPGGLGRAQAHDVFAEPTVTLAVAMAAAADRDRIARQYATCFDDIFEQGLAWADAALDRWGERRWATLAIYLGYLAAFPDTHIVRKHSAARAEDVRREAAIILSRLQDAAEPDLLTPDLLEWDAALKSEAINPGTSADLTVATLFAHRLRSILPCARNSD
jgi:triphosphoribosyl-dephospho-CoA synthase